MEMHRQIAENCRFQRMAGRSMADTMAILSPKLDQSRDLSQILASNDSLIYPLIVSRRCETEHVGCLRITHHKS